MRAARSLHTDTRVGHVIETRFAGHRFRSRTEARWCVFFDALGVQWEYEPQGYIVRGKPYLPDFYIHDWQAWWEVKSMGDQHQIYSFTWKLQQLRRDTRALQAYVCFGSPDLIRGSQIYDDQCCYNWVDENGPTDCSPSEGRAYEAYRRAMEERFDGKAT